MDSAGLTFDMLVVLALLAFTIFLFLFEIVRVDVAAFLVMIILGGLASLPGMEGLIDVGHLFDGFASNAVISIIAVMITGAGLDRTGVMSKVSRMIMNAGGKTETRIIPLISGTVGVISSFMQNVGAAALFIPVVSRISMKTGLPLSRLLMPMGFCAILGGTITMVGSSPLILLNDLILSANDSIPDKHRMETFELFDVAPVGFALLISGILYFVFLGRYLLPTVPETSENSNNHQDMADYLSRLHHFDGTLYEVIVPPGSTVIDQNIKDIQVDNNLYIVAMHVGGRTFMEPPGDMVFDGSGALAVLADSSTLDKFVAVHGLQVRPKLDLFSDDLGPDIAGVAELVIPPESAIIGKSARDIWSRKTYGLAMLAIYRDGESLSRVSAENHEAVDVGSIPMKAGDIIFCHTEWRSLTRLERDRNFVIVTADYPHEELRPKKVGFALLFFSIAIALVLFSDVRLSLCLLIGAVGMIVSRVLSMDEAFEAISWQTVFLLASLIPLGQAVQSTGTAEWIAQQIVTPLDGAPVWAIQLVIAILATGFTLVMSNVGATVLLVPLAINIAISIGADPALFALTVAVATSNSFLIPTHQVNALIMGPAGFRVSDFMRVGSGMTVLFLVVSLIMLQVI